MTFRSPAVVPPTMLPVPPKIITPLFRLPTAALPDALVPIMLPVTVLLDAPDNSMPWLSLPLIRLLRRVLLFASIRMPVKLPVSRVPAASVPMKFPSITLPLDCTHTPYCVLPLITLRAPAVDPPMVFPVAPFWMRTPSALPHEFT